MWLFQPFKWCYYDIIVPCGHWRWPPVTWKQFPSLALGNECWRVSRGYSNCWRLQWLLEAVATFGSCSDCWKLRRVAGEACDMTENVLSIFNCDFFRTTPTNRDLWQKAVYFPAWNERYRHHQQNPYPCPDSMVLAG